MIAFSEGISWHHVDRGDRSARTSRCYKGRPVVDIDDCLAHLGIHPLPDGYVIDSRCRYSLALEPRPYSPRASGDRHRYRPQSDACDDEEENRTRFATFPFYPHE